MLIMVFLVQTSPNQGEIMEPYVLKLWLCNYSKDYINENPFEGGPASKHAALYAVYCLPCSFKFLCYVYDYVNDYAYMCMCKD